MSRRTHDHILLSHLRLPQPGGPGPRIHIPQEQGGRYTPGHWVPFSSLLTTIACYDGGILIRLHTGMIPPLLLCLQDIGTDHTKTTVPVAV
jgi:hypothetical protein